jgi:hypothetical protein
MESIKIEILQPKVLALIKDLVDLKLIKIKVEEPKKDYNKLLLKLRSKSKDAPSIDEIGEEVDKVRANRYAK